MLLERFYPDLYLKSVFELPLAELKRRGIRALVFDIDNTIAPFDVAEPEESIVELFQCLRQEGFALCILSNNSEERVQRFNRPLGALAIHKAGKPATAKLRRAMAYMGSTPASTAIVGDQVFTDMWCGHRAGLYCIMTAPICDRDQLITKVKRGAERWVMRRYFRKSGK